MSLLENAYEVFECNNKHFDGVRIKQRKYTELHTKLYDYVLKENDIITDSVGKKYKIMEVSVGTVNIPIVTYKIIEVEVME